MRKKITLSERIKIVEQTIEQLDRQVTLKIPKEFHEHILKNGYYSQVVLHTNDSTFQPYVTIQTLTDRMRFTFDLGGLGRIILYDFYYE